MLFQVLMNLICNLVLDTILGQNYQDQVEMLELQATGQHMVPLSVD